MKKTRFLFPILLILLGCGKTHYTHIFEKGKHVDFSQGKWILNPVLTNYDKYRVQDIALREFKEILADSLMELDGLRTDKLIPASLPFDLSPKELKEIKLGTDCDYIITIKATILKEQMGSLATPPRYGTTIKTNQAQSTIKIYDLNELTLLSESTVTGTASVTKNYEEKNWDYVHSAGGILLNSLSRAIKQYRKNQIK